MCRVTTTNVFVDHEGHCPGASGIADWSQKVLNIPELDRDPWARDEKIVMNGFQVDGSRTERIFVY